MKRAYTNGILLDGTEQMQPVEHKILLTEDDKITAIADEGVDLDGYEVIDLHGSYIMPGLVNLHVHLAGNGKPSAKPRDNAALVRKILSNGLTRAVAYRLVCSYAKLELLGGVTTIRTVGGIADFDTRCRDDAAAGRLLAPRILAANEGISVPGGHMAGSVAVAAHNIDEALREDEERKQGDFNIKKADYLAEMAKLEKEFITHKDQEQRRIAQLKITIPNDLKEIYEIVSNLGK